MEEPGGELQRLEAWGSTLTGNHSRQLDELIREFYAEKPSPSMNPFERLPPLEMVSDVEIGPGLLRVLETLTAFRVVRITDIVLRSIEEPTTGLAERIKDRDLGALISALKTGTKASMGRAPHMKREAEKDELALNVNDYAEALATILRAAKGEFTFALFGPWGSGKTTITGLLKSILQPQQNDNPTNSASRDTKGQFRYEVAIHNAWKYRTPPEAWIYVYKSLADCAASNLGPFGKFMLAVRASHIRNGLWPLVGALSALALLLIPIGATLQLAAIATSLVGVGAVTQIAAISPKVQAKVRELFVKHARLTSSPESLGMLALVGEDIRALVAARTVDDGASPIDAGGAIGLPLVALFFVAVVWCVGIAYPGPQPGVILMIPELLSSALRLLGVNPSQAWCEAECVELTSWATWAGWIILSLGMTIGPWLLMSAKSPNRMLLVVDDLDRCTSDEMLDVIENMKLLVDDPSLSERLQILMLVDERMLGLAIAERYRLLIEQRTIELGAVPLAGSIAREEIIAEQKEKLFACHLRLANLQDSEVGAVVSSLSSSDLAPYRQRARESELARRREQLEDERNKAAEADKSKRALDNEYDALVKGEYHEEALIDVDGPSTRQVPRAVRQTIPDAIMPPTAEERKWRIEENERIKARNARRRQESDLSPEERLNFNPDLVSRRQKATEEAEERRKRLADMEADFSERRSEITPPPFTDSDVRFTSDEVDDLERLVPDYFRTIRRRPSPRAVRMLLFKIQLFRLLVQTRLPGRSIDSFSIKKILGAFEKAALGDEPAHADTGQEKAEDEMVSIAKQVI